MIQEPASMTQPPKRSTKILRAIVSPYLLVAVLAFMLGMLLTTWTTPEVTRQAIYDRRVAESALRTEIAHTNQLHGIVADLKEQNDLLRQACVDKVQENEPTAVEPNRKASIR